MALILTVKAIPNAGKQGFFCDKAGILKCYLKSAPEQGKANNELQTLLSKHLNIPKNLITLLSGATNRTKVFKIDAPMTHTQACELLGAFQQLTIR